MTDLATLGLRIESQEVATADQRLDALTASAGQAEAGVDSLAAAARGLGGALLPTLQSIDKSVGELLALTRMQAQVTGQTVQHAAATRELATELNGASTAGMLFRASAQLSQETMGGAAAAARNWGEAVQQADAHVVAFRQHLAGLNAPMVQQNAHVLAYRQHLGKLGDVDLPRVQRGMGLTAQEGLNLSRQFADIGVTAAMGMNPLMIAIQQGPQLLDIFQTAAIRTGQTTTQVARQMAASWAAALWPLLPIIAAISAAVGGMAAGFGLATRDMSRDIGDLRDGLNLTEDQLKKLKESGEQTTITMGDYFRGLGTTINEMFQETFGPQLDWVQEKVGAALDWMTTAWATWIRIVLTGAVGAFNAVRTTWSQLPAVMGDVTVSAANTVIKATEQMINGSVGLINGMLGGLRRLAAGNSAFAIFNFVPDLEAVDFDPIANRWEGAAARAGQNIAGAYQDAWRDVGAWQVEFMDRLEANVRASGQARVREAAGDAGDPAKARQSQPDRIDLLRPGRVDLTPLNTRLPDGFRTQLEVLADELRMIDQLTQDMGRGMASAFGEAGQALGDLMTTMSAYQSRQAEIALAVEQNRLTEAQGAREQAHAQIGYYGDMAAAAKGFFAEGSDGYRILQAAEQGWRLFQFAMSLQAMAQDATETASSVANSAARGTASTAAGAAKIFEDLGAYAFPVVAAMIALLAGLGLSSGGGGGKSSGSGSSSVADTTESVRATNQRETQAREAATTAIAAKVDVKVTADRDGLNAYVSDTARDVAAPMVAQGSAMAVGAARSSIANDIAKERTYGLRRVG